MSEAEKKRFSAANTRKVLKEPIAIFAIIAVGIFAYDAWFSGSGDRRAAAISSVPDSRTGDTLVVTENMIENLEDNFRWLEGRAPSADEREELIERWIDEEVLFREALAQQMHMNDGKMRAHLVEKVRMLWAGSPAPDSEADLLDFYTDNMDEYYTEETVSFRQVYFQTLPEDAGAILSRIQEGEMVEGDSYWLGNNLNEYSESILRTSFGGEFYQELLAAPENQWVGPLESARGYHFVRVSAIGEPQLLSYGEVRDRLTSDWADAHRRSNVRQRTGDIRDRFSIVVESGDN